MPFTIHRTISKPREIVMGGLKITVQPPPTENKQGRKKMVDDKIKDETDVKKISQEPADKQGPVGDTGPRPPQPQPSEDVKIGNKEKDNA